MSLEVKDLSLVKNKDILKNISFSLIPGEKLFLIGNNGSGKTSLLKCLLNTERKYTGDIYFNGIDIKSMSAFELAKMRSYVPQSVNSQIPHTVGEFLSYARYRDFSHGCVENLDRVLSGCLSKFQLDEIRDTLLTSLSGGERQRVFVAAAYHQNADILLLDEIHSSLDFKNKDLINNVLKTDEELKNKIFVQATHDLNFALENGNKILALKNGEVVFYGTPIEILENKTLDQVFDKEFEYMNSENSTLKWVKY